jgi:hypothetical protein
MLRLAFSTLAARKRGDVRRLRRRHPCRRPRRVVRAPPRVQLARADPGRPPRGRRGRRPGRFDAPASGRAGQRQPRAARADARAAEVVDEHDRVLTDVDEGHGWSSAALTRLRLRSGYPPTAVADVVVDAAAAPGTHLGERLRIDTTAGRSTFTVVGIATSPRSSRYPAVYVRDDVARRLSARADLVGLLLERGVDPANIADRARDSLDGSGLRVLTGAKRGEAESIEGALARARTSSRA